MINAIVQNKHGETAVIDLTVHYHEIYKELQSLGYYGSPERLLLRDEEDEEYSVKLYSDSDIGNSMILLLNERDSLYDAYLLDLAVTNAREEIKTDLEQNLLHGQYTTFSEVLDDINQMKIAAAETRLTFFCPLKATIYDDEGYYSPASNYTISDNRDEIEDMLGIEQLPDLGDMAEYVGEHSGIGNKLIYAVWGLEEIRGEVYGKIDCYLTEALNAEETEKLRDAVCGQNSDGFGESFEQRAIKTEDGELYVSFWNSSDDYFLYTPEEITDISYRGSSVYSAEPYEPDQGEDEGFTMSMWSVIAMNTKERIEAFNKAFAPFYIVDHDDGGYSLCLPLDLLSDDYYPYCQDAFDAYAEEVGEPARDENGLKTHGSGYEWEAAFRQAFADDPNIGRILFDCEAGGFFCECYDLSMIEDFGKRFKEICEDTERFTPIVSEGIKNAEARLAEQEKLPCGKIYARP